MVRSVYTAAAALGAVVIGALSFAAPASADVTVTPSDALRGGAARVTFDVPEERPGAYTSKVELQIPSSTPIAEVYPMSTNDWAPLTTTRTLDKPLVSLHGPQTTQVVSAITWKRVVPAGSRPTKPASLNVSIGPLPQADRVVFNVIQTYSDGTVVRWTDPPTADGKPAGKHPAPTVNLLGQADGSAHHGGGSQSDAPAQADAAASHAGAATADNDEYGSYGVMGAGLLIGVALGLGASLVVILRNRRTSTASARAARQRLLGQQ